jgi:hypothetical protein
MNASGTSHNRGQGDQVALGMNSFLALAAHSEAATAGSDLFRTGRSHSVLEYPLMMSSQADQSCNQLQGHSCWPAQFCQ